MKPWVGGEGRDRCAGWGWGPEGQERRRDCQGREMLSMGARFLKCLLACLAVLDLSSSRWDLCWGMRDLFP